MAFGTKILQIFNAIVQFNYDFKYFIHVSKELKSDVFVCVSAGLMEAVSPSYIKIC